MTKTSKLTQEEQVSNYYSNLDHPLANIVLALREIILATDPQIGEQIKWNSPGFYYTGEMKPFDPKEYRRDIVVINLHKKDQVLLVFPTGASVKDKTGLLEGKFNDSRKIAKFTSPDNVKKREKDLQTVLKEWLKSVER